MLLSSSSDLIRFPFSHSITRPSSVTRPCHPHTHTKTKTWLTGVYMHTKILQVSMCAITQRHIHRCTHIQMLCLGEFTWPHTHTLINVHSHTHKGKVHMCCTCAGTAEYYACRIHKESDQASGAHQLASASSYTLCCSGRQRLVIALTAPFKKEKVIAFCSIATACMTNQAQQSVGGTHFCSVPLCLCQFWYRAFMYGGLYPSPLCCELRLTDISKLQGSYGGKKAKKRMNYECVFANTRLCRLKWTANNISVWLQM